MDILVARGLPIVVSWGDMKFVYVKHETSHRLLVGELAPQYVLSESIIESFNKCMNCASQASGLCCHLGRHMWSLSFDLVLEVGNCD